MSGLASSTSAMHSSRTCLLASGAQDRMSLSWQLHTSPLNVRRLNAEKLTLLLSQNAMAEGHMSDLPAQDLAFSTCLPQSDDAYYLNTPASLDNSFHVGPHAWFLQLKATDYQNTCADRAWCMLCPLATLGHEPCSNPVRTLSEPP